MEREDLLLPINTLNIEKKSEKTITNEPVSKVEEELLKPNPNVYENTEQTGFVQSEATTLQNSQPPTQRINVQGGRSSSLMEANEVVFEKEKEKMENIVRKIDEFGIKHFGHNFHNQINQHTQDSMKILTDPNLPKVEDYSNSEKLVLSVSSDKSLNYSNLKEDFKAFSGALENENN